MLYMETKIVESSRNETSAMLLTGLDF